MVIAELLRFTVNGFAVDDFLSVFPRTQIPHVSLFSGQPRIDRTIFNSLLASKLSELRSRLGVQSTPVGSVSLVSSWINRLLANQTKNKQAKKKPASDNKGKKKTSASCQNAKKTKVQFTPAASQQEIPLPEVPITTVDTPDVHPKLSDYLQALPANDSSLDFKTFDALRQLPTADSVATARLLINDNAHIFAQVRLLTQLNQYLPAELFLRSTTLILVLSALTSIPVIRLSYANFREDRFQFEAPTHVLSEPGDALIQGQASLLFAFDLLRPFFAHF